MRTKTLEIGRAFYEALKDVASGGCFPVIADHGAAYPFITYRREYARADASSKDGRFCDTAEVEVKVAAARYDESVALAQECKERLDGARFSLAGLAVISCECSGGAETWSGDAYVQTLKFTLKVV